MKVVVGGPPHSGKSTFTAALIETIRDRIARRERELSFGWLTLDVTDNSLGYLLDPSGATPRRESGAEWSEPNARARAARFSRRSERLVIADAPGLLTPELDIVIEPADAMIILAYEGEANRIHRWERKAAENDLDVLAEFVSVMDPGRRPFWDRTAGKGVVRGVQLEEFRTRRLDAYDATTRRIIRRLGRHLIDMAAHSAERSDSSR